MVTGSLLPADDQTVWDVPDIIFMCTPHLDGRLSFVRWDDRCFVYFDPVSRHARKPASAQLIDELEAPLSAIAHPARLRILHLLAERGTLYAQEVVDETGFPQASVANHLASLSPTGLISVEQRANRRYYTLIPDAVKNVVDSLGRLFFL